jgi:hypothetical protein
LWQATAPHECGRDLPTLSRIELAIGIPTRNRAELATAAIESALRDGDAAVFVSDNSTDPDEQRRLERFCASAAGRVEYLRPPEPLTMAAHWEWLWRTIRESSGPSHVAYLTDRMVLAAGALRSLMEVVERHPDRVVSYHHDNVDDLEAPVELVQTPWTGRLVELDSRRLIELSSRGRYGDYLPRLLNCIAPSDVLDAIEQRFGDVFGTVAPDYRFAYRCLAVCDTVLYLDRACLIEHGHTRSAGGGLRRGHLNPDGADYVAQLSEPRFGATPAPALETLANAVFQEYCTVREEAGAERFPELDQRGYLTANAISIDRIENPDHRAAMRAVLRRLGWSRLKSARHGAELALAMAGYFLAHPVAIPRTLKRQLWDRPPGTPFAFLLPRLRLDPHVREDYKFASSADAIAHANAHPRAPTPHAWHLHRLERAGAVVGDGR